MDQFVYVPDMDDYDEIYANIGTIYDAFHSVSSNDSQSIKCDDIEGIVMFNKESNSRDCYVANITSIIKHAWDNGSYQPIKNVKYDDVKIQSSVEWITFIVKNATYTRDGKNYTAPEDISITIAKSLINLNYIVNIKHHQMNYVERNED